MPTATDHCTRLRTALLSLHQKLIDLERGDYEKRNGPQSAGEFLQVMAYGDEMAWLEPLSRLIVMLDEALSPNGDATLTPAVVAARVRELLTWETSRDGLGDFTSRYVERFDRSPDLAVLHAEVLRTLRDAA